MLDQLRKKIKKGQWWDTILFYSTNRPYAPYKPENDEEHLFLLFLSVWVNYLIRMFNLPINTTIKLANQILQLQMKELGIYVSPENYLFRLENITHNHPGTRKFKHLLDQGFQKFYIRVNRYTQKDEYLFIKKTTDYYIVTDLDVK